MTQFPDTVFETQFSWKNPLTELGKIVTMKDNESVGSWLRFIRCRRWIFSLSHPAADAV